MPIDCSAVILQKETIVSAIVSFCSIKVVWRLIWGKLIDRTPRRSYNKTRNTNLILKDAYITKKIASEGDSAL